MHYSMVRCALLLALVTSACLCQQLSQRMANQDVIEMVALGLSDEVIIAKIHAIDSTNFDTSVKALRALKAGKVSDAVIRTMINAKSAAAAVDNNASVKNDIELPTEIGVYLLSSGRLVDIEPEIVGWQTGGVLKHYATLGIDKGHVNGKVRVGFLLAGFADMLIRQVSLRAHQVARTSVRAHIGWMTERPSAAGSVQYSVIK